MKVFKFGGASVKRMPRKVVMNVIGEFFTEKPRFLEGNVCLSFRQWENNKYSFRSCCGKLFTKDYKAETAKIKTEPY